MRKDHIALAALFTFVGGTLTYDINKVYPVNEPLTVLGVKTTNEKTILTVSDFPFNIKFPNNISDQFEVGKKYDFEVSRVAIAQLNGKGSNVRGESFKPAIK